VNGNEQLSGVAATTTINTSNNRQSAVANALQLEAALAAPAYFRFNYVATPSLKSLNLSIAVL